MVDVASMFNRCSSKNSLAAVGLLVSPFRLIVRKRLIVILTVRHERCVVESTHRPCHSLQYVEKMNSEHGTVTIGFDCKRSLSEDALIFPWASYKLAQEV